MALSSPSPHCSQGQTPENNFLLIVLGTLQPQRWPSPTLCPCLPRWALGLQCQGSRNVLGALRKAIEVDFKDKTKHESQGIYLFTGGVPDQDVVSSPPPRHLLSCLLFFFFFLSAIKLGISKGKACVGLQSPRSQPIVSWLLGVSAHGQDRLHNRNAERHAAGFLPHS